MKVFANSILIFQMENPWNIESIYELQYFNCPVCIFKDHSKQELIYHAFENHPDCINYLEKITDNSLKDVSLPWNNEPITEIKLEPTETDDTELDIGPLNCEPHIEIEDDFGEKIITFDENPIANPSENDHITETSESILTNINVEGLTEVKIENCFDEKSIDLSEQGNDFGNVLEDPLKSIYNYCEICDQYFSSKNTFDQHLNFVHKTMPLPRNKHSNGKKSFGAEIMNCKYCGKIFNKTSNFKSHVKTVHEGVKEHKCETCGKLFGQLSNLKTHIKNVHEGQKDHKCVRCEKSFSSKRSLDVHVKTVHEGKKEHKCETCGKEFGQLVTLKKHIKICHEEQNRIKSEII